MTEHDEPTEADLEELAQKLEAFGDQLSPGQKAAFKTLLVNAASDPDEAEPAGGPGEITALQMERSVSTASHAENHSAETRFTVPPPRVFYVMGVPVFEY